MRLFILAACVAVTFPVQAQVVATSQSGTAVFGTESKAIKNVAANDTVNGAPATLGAGGNAVVSLTKPQQKGFALNTTTGALTTTLTTPVGTFSIGYQICDAANPTDCATAQDPVTVVSSVATLPIAGSAVANTNGVPIEDVAIPDTVDGVPATVGPSGNAVVAEGTGWPDGFALNASTGEIDIAPSVLPGTYSLTFTLCNASLPTDCAVQVATVLVNAQPFTETQATATAMGDVEFDWGRDGVPCTTCNFGDGNDRANWTDRKGNIWIAHLDIATGQFVLPGANDVNADTHAYFWNEWGNGPEWAFSTQGGQVISQLVYSRFQTTQTAPPQPKPGFAGAGFVTQTAYNTWESQFFPGAIIGGGQFNSNLPEASQCNSDPVSLAVWKSLGADFSLYNEAVSPTGTKAILVPPQGVKPNGIGERFVPCTHQLLYQASAPVGNSGQTVQQVFWYDIDTGATEQLTTDPVNKYSGFMFKAPDFGDNYIFYTVADHRYIKVFEETSVNADGSPNFELVNTIYSPLTDQQYLNTSEPFINCTPTCATYAFITIANGNSQNGIEKPNGLAVVALNPATPMFEIIVSSDAPATRQRLDPEYFITPQGPYIYYNRIIPLQPGESRYQNQGEWFIDMQLGAPSGTCVGSSAEDGLPPGC